MIRRITIVRSRIYEEPSLNEDIHSFCNALGLFNPRDKESSLYRIFVEILKSARTGHGLSSDELALRTQLSRGTVMHHMNKLMDAGIVTSQDTLYYLRVNNLEELTVEIARDIERTFAELSRTAKRIDAQLGI